jgi:16S rRNA pseudouridine516 synthase
MRLDRLLSNRGYCSRSEVRHLLRTKRIRIDDTYPSSPSTMVNPDSVFIDDEKIDPEVITIMLHKPTGFVCSHREQGRLIYELLPERWSQRKPQLSSVGRLDKESSGLLILTTDGQLNHQLTQPKKVGKVYEVTVRDKLSGEEASLFQSGTFTLPDESEPLLPADFMPRDDYNGVLTIYEGKYHQIRRMFGALGNEVIKLHRTQVGNLPLLPTEAGSWCFLSPEQLSLALAPSFLEKHT